jgi:hypothetical protein
MHFDVVTNKEYASLTVTADGASIIKVTGSFVVTFTNGTTGKSITLNASGPGTFTFPANSSLQIVDANGLSFWVAPNLSEFGLPNAFLSSGPLQLTADRSNFQVVSVARQPHVLVDICAALGPFPTNEEQYGAYFPPLETPCRRWGRREHCVCLATETSTPATT